MTDKTREFILYLCLTSFGLAGLLIILNLAVDPWRYFRDSQIAVLEDEGRSQNPGLIRNKTFDAIIVGTSLAQKFKSSEIDSLLGVDSVVLSISGGLAREQYLTARLALSQQKIKMVIWDVNPGAFLAGTYATKGNAFPAYLYDDSVVNDLFYLFNVSNTEKSLGDLNHWLTSSSGNKINGSDTWKNAQFWAHNRTLGCPHMLQTQIQRRGLPGDGDKQRNRDPAEKNPHLEIEDARTNIGNPEETFVVNVVSLVDEFPETDFYFYLPPFSMLYWSLIQKRKPDTYRITYDFMQMASEHLHQRKNVKLYNFMNATSIVTDLKNYGDLIHYSADVNSWITENLASGQYLFPHHARDEFFRSFHQTILGYPHDRVISECLKQQIE